MIRSYHVRPEETNTLLIIGFHAKNYGRTCRTLIGYSFCMGVEYGV
ncbi:hypothetical protein HMPREF1494_1857 [Bifidobacterium sp. MSTE12]|nr:hypothetical protein HMPREF1494_1857 [Bifidobacterium sp. MSTE12]